MVQGGSYGGHMTLAVAYVYSDRIRCAIDVVGPSNFVTFLQNTSGYRRDLRRVEYGDERDPKMRAFLEKTAPLNNAEKIRKPLFIIQGGNDPRVPLSESEQMLKKIRERRDAGLVPHGEGRGPRLREEVQPRLRVLLLDPVHEGVPAEVTREDGFAVLRASSRGAKRRGIPSTFAAGS